MSLTSDQEHLKRYALEHPADIFTKIDEMADTYWNDKTENAGVMEYCFETPIEMMELISKFIPDTDLQQIVVASAFKRKNIYIDNSNNTEITDKEKLPEFVYAF